ncbi:hypothetical protein VTO73DRAFT_4852 [Trametes versicolor]
MSDLVPSLEYRALSPIFVERQPRPLQRVTVDARIAMTAYRRLTRLADYGDSAEASYSLTRVPEDIIWHEVVNPPVLYAHGLPLGLRVVGSLADFGINTSDTDAHFFFDINPIRPIDHEGMLRLLDLAYPPPVTVVETMRIRCTAEEGHKASPLIYDATRCVRPEHFMDRMRVSQLGVSDVVMVDCLVIKGNHRSGWEVLFELLSLLVLERVPV